MSPDPEAALAQVRALALAMPESAERTSHGSPGFHIEKGKFFAYFWHNHHNDGETICIVKTTGREEQAMLIELDSTCYYSPPYLGASGWVAMRLDGDVDWDRVGDRIAISWELVAPAAIAGGWRTMTEEAPPPTTETVQDAVDRAEAAATRRRWITLAELVGLAGVIITALGLWLTWSDRRAQADEKQVESLEKTRFEVNAAVGSNGDLTIQRDDRHALGDIDVAFPSALSIGLQTSSVQTISRHWYERALLAASDGGPDKQSGKLPVLLTVKYWDGDTQRSLTGIYDIVWHTEGRVLLGRLLKVDGLRLRSRSGATATLDTIWTREKPKT